MAKKRDFSEIAKTKQAQRLKERPAVERGMKRTQTNTPKQTPSTNPEYSKYSTIKTKYDNGTMPKRHKALYDGICQALGDGVLEGEVNMGLILDDIDMNRKSAANILGHLTYFGFLKHERRPRGTYVWILK